MLTFSEETKTIIGIVIAIFGGASIRVIDRLFLKSSKDKDENGLRAELRHEIEERNEEIDTLQRDVNKWREKYWKEVSVHSETKTKLHFASHENISVSLTPVSGSEH